MPIGWPLHLKPATRLVITCPCPPSCRQRDDHKCGYLPGPAYHSWPATCWVATLSRFQTLMLAIERTRAASAGSS